MGSRTHGAESSGSAQIPAPRSPASPSRIPAGLSLLGSGSGSVPSKTRLASNPSSHDTTLHSLQYARQQGAVLVHQVRLQGKLPGFRSWRVCRSLAL